MARIELKKAKTWEVLDDDYYVAEVSSVEVVMHDADDYHKDGPYEQLKWTFLLHIPGREDHPTFVAWTSFSTHKKSKLYPLVKALGINVDSTGFDTDSVIGRFVKINVVQYEKNDGTYGNKASSYSPYRGPELPSARTSSTPNTTLRKAPAAPELDEGDIPF